MKLMKKLIVFIVIIIILPIICFSQVNLKELRKRSWQTFVYQVSAIDAEQFLKWDSIPVSRFITAPVFGVYVSADFESRALPAGHYVVIDIEDNKINTQYINNSNLIILTINNKQQLQIDVRKKNGDAVTGARVFVNNKEAKFSSESKTFWVQQKKYEDAFVKVYTDKDTLFTSLAGKDDLRLPISRQIKNNYKASLIYKILNWLPRQIRNLFKPVKKKYTYANGYMIFNQPKYKPLDTVKFKAYIVDKKWRQYKKEVELHLKYYTRGESIDKLIDKLDPVTAGAYTGQFVLADTLPSDIRYTLELTTGKQKKLLSNWFEIEDYVLDEIGTYSFKKDKEIYFRNDTLRFSAEAKDGNGLNVMDASASLLLTVSSIDRFYADTIFVADTIYRQEKKLATDNVTSFTIPANSLPKADITVNANLVFKNSNNELHEENQSFVFKYASKEILVVQEEDSVSAIFLDNGVSVVKNGEMEVNDDTAIAIQYPFKIKIDPVADEYTFYADTDKKESLVSRISIENNYRVSFSRRSNQDTLGFVLDNPYKIPVYFTVLNGKKVIASGKETSEKITWNKRMDDRRQSYKLRWQYIWGGEEKTYEENIALLYKLLKVDINTSPNIFPGQKDSLKISVTDYKGRPATNVNLTAVSYNNQFKNKIRVADPPYLVKYKGKKFIEHEGAEEDKADGITKKYLLGQNKSWIHQFGVDTMAYYNFLFPKSDFYDAATLIEDYLPQVAVNVVQKGVPQEIYMLYLDRRLVYYNGVTDKMNYAFNVYPGYIQIGIRLRDKYIEIDSFYIQSHYKHDISFDLDKLPPSSRITEAAQYWSSDEMALLERSMWQMQNNYANNNSYLWQGSSVTRLNGSRPHIAGPFETRQLNFFNPGHFDISFNFEPGYQYDLSKQILRLEKMSLFPKKDVKNFLPLYNNSTLLLGDTITEPPVISYPPAPKQRTILLSDNMTSHYQYAQLQPGKGSLQFTYRKDSVLNYVILQPADVTKQVLVMSSYYRKIMNIVPGKYNLLLVSNNFYTATFANIVINADGTTCVKGDSLYFVKDNAVVERLILESEERMAEKNNPVEPKKELEKVYLIPETQIYTNTKGATVYGIVLDKKGRNPVPFASVYIKGSKAGVIADANGLYMLSKLRPGKYMIQVAAAGYQKEEIEVEVAQNGSLRIDVLLVASGNWELKEVVVTGAFGVKRSARSMSSSVQIVNGDILTANVNNALAGKVAGVQVRSASAAMFGVENVVRLRGENGLSLQSGAIYVIDGIIYKTMPANINEGNIKDISVLDGPAAAALFGPEASNGAIIITTTVKILRDQFKDYALWQPNFFTDKNGKASAIINYPDNVTGWKTYVVAMDKKRRIGKGYTFTQAYKPLLAQLSAPQFLVEGDSAVIIGKRVNYTADKYTISSSFFINGKEKQTTQSQLQPNDASIEDFIVTDEGKDTLSAGFKIESITGFKDGEQRKIPVVKKGIEETIGNFWILQKDTTVLFNAMDNASGITLYAQNNTLDVLLDELDHLRQYPYYCMEQTASKLTGLALERKIRMQLKQSFTNEKELSRLLLKIQKAQLFEGGWAWWENGKANFYISNYVADALLQFRDNPLVETNIRNAFLYLQNQLPFLHRGELLAALTTLSEGKFETGYAQYLNTMPFDSLSQHQQWQWVKIKQQQKMNYKEELKKLVDKRIATMLGGVHWGEDVYRWYANDIATTVIAFEVLKNEEAYKNLLPAVMQYFLEKRGRGYWRNTVESASILNSILPFVFEQQKDFMQPASLTISGDTNFIINTFPSKIKLGDKPNMNLRVTKSGGGLVYFTAYQKIFNKAPEPVENNFIIQTGFKKNGITVADIKSGEKVKMIIEVNVLKDADFVMLQIPIPAGCTYADKNNSDWKVFKEFHKDKMLLFAEYLSKGMHQFEINLEPRYNGRYTLNPVKAELMYFPTFYGRNKMQTIEIR
jgi:hypothetical protein